VRWFGPGKNAVAFDHRALDSRVDWDDVPEALLGDAHEVRFVTVYPERRRTFGGHGEAGLAGGVPAHRARSLE
jgi:hypothetical protein